MDFTFPEPSIDDEPGEDQSHEQTFDNPLLCDCKDLAILAHQGSLEFECGNKNKKYIFICLHHICFDNICSTCVEPPSLNLPRQRYRLVVSNRTSKSISCVIFLCCMVCTPKLFFKYIFCLLYNYYTTNLVQTMLSNIVCYLLQFSKLVSFNIYTLEAMLIDFFTRLAQSQSKYMVSLSFLIN